MVRSRHEVGVDLPIGEEIRFFGHLFFEITVYYCEYYIQNIYGFIRSKTRNAIIFGQRIRLLLQKTNHFN